VSLPLIQIYRNGGQIELIWDLQSRLLYRTFNLYGSATEGGVYTKLVSNIPNASTPAFPRSANASLLRQELGVGIDDPYYFKITSVSILGVESDVNLSHAKRVPPVHVIGPRTRDDPDIMSQLLAWDATEEEWRRVELINVSGIDRLAVDADLSGVSITVGAVEIKDGDSALKMDVKNDGIDNAAVFTANVLPLPTGAATERTPSTVSTDLSELLLRVGDNVAVPAANTVLARLKALEDQITDHVDVYLSDSAGNGISSTGTALDVYIAGGSSAGTEYTVDDAAPATPSGPSVLAIRDDALSTLTEADGDWTNLRTSSRGALWVEHDGILSVEADITNAPSVKIQDSAGNALGSTSGALDVNVASGSLTADIDAVGLLDNSATPSRINPATEDGNLAVIAGDTTSIDSKIPTLGQKTMAGSSPVVIASDQSSIPVTDNGGSLTVDGLLTVQQGTHDNLNANANLQVGNVDVSTGNPVPVDIQDASLTVDIDAVGILDNSATPVRISPAREDGNLATIAGDTTSLDSKVTVANTSDTRITQIGGATGTNSFYYENATLNSTTFVDISPGFTTQGMIFSNALKDSIAEISFDGGTTVHATVRAYEVVTFDFRHVTQIHVRKKPATTPNPDFRAMAW